MDRHSIIQRTIDALGARTYLEIGVAAGYLFLSVKCERKIAVDPHLRVPALRKVRHAMKNIGSHYFEETSDEFFARHESLFAVDRIDVAFVDGLHTYSQSLRDFENCMAHLAPGGVIVMHDCNPVTEELEDIKWSGDVWKAILHIRSSRSDLNVAVLDCDFGVAVITRGLGRKIDFDLALVPQLTFEDLGAHRREWLNLQPPEYLEDFLRLVPRASDLRSAHR